MASFIGVIKKVFGTKQDRDMKLVKPILEKVLAAYKEIDGHSNDALRARTEARKAGHYGD